MIRNLKALGLTLAAMLVIGAMSASVASALTTDVFTAGKTKVWATGTSHNNVFTMTGPNKSVECTTSKFTGTIENETTKATVLAAYNGKINEALPHGIECSGLGSPEIKMNHCHYLLTGETNKEDPGVANKDAEAHITCEAGKSIEIVTTIGVTIKVPAQTPTTGGVAYKKLPTHSGGEAVEVIATVTGLTYSCAPTFTCTLGGLPHHGQDADYVGSVQVTGYEHLGGTFTSPTEGARVPITFHEK